MWNTFLVLTVLSMLIGAGRSQDKLTPEEIAAVKEVGTKVTRLIFLDVG